MTSNHPKQVQKKQAKPPHQELQPYKNALVHAQDSDSISTALQQIDQKLVNQPPVLNGSLELHKLVNDILKPITRQITNCRIRQGPIVKIMQSIIRKIILQYISIFRIYGTSSVLQILKELLYRDTFLFIKHQYRNNDRFRAGTEMRLQVENIMSEHIQYTDQEEKAQQPDIVKYQIGDLQEQEQWSKNHQQQNSAGAYNEKVQQKQHINNQVTNNQSINNQPTNNQSVNPEFSQKQKMVQQIVSENKYKWVISTHSKYSNFFLNLVQSLLTGLQGIQEQFSTMPLDSIVQFYHLLYAVNDVIDRERIIQIVRAGLCKISIIFHNPSKQLIKEANKDSLERLSDSMNQCLRQIHDFDLKTQISLLGPILGIQLFKQATIYQKMQGLKIINKFASALSYKHINYLPQSQFSRWLNNEHLFEMIYNLESSLSLIQAADDIFKCYARCKLLKSQLLQRYINLLDSCQSQSRIYLLKLLESVSLKIDNEEVFIILEKFQTLRKIQFYTEDFFALISAICKYNSQFSNRNAYRILENIVNQYYQQFSQFIKIKCMNCCISIFHNILDKMSFSKSKLEDAVKIAENFLTNPTNFNLSIMKRIFQVFPENTRVTKNSLVTYVIQKLKFLNNLLEILQKNKHLDQNDLQNLIKFLLKHYKFNKTVLQLKTIEDLFPYSNMIHFAYHSQIFCQIVEFIFREKNRMIQQNNSGEIYLHNLLMKLMLYLQTTENCFQFQCIKILFCLINEKKINRIDKDIVQRQFQYSANPKDFLGFHELKQLLCTTRFNEIIKDCAGFIVEMYTLPAQSHFENYQLILLQFMEESFTTFTQAYNQFIKSKTKQNKYKLTGTLYLLLQLLSATEPFGVGQLASHNSLVATGTVVVRINNEFTEGQDVLKVFQKKYPSNTMIFEVIRQACNQFKCCPADVLLKNAYRKVIPLKYNSWTLDQVPFDCKNLTIFRTFRNLMTKKSLLNEKGQLNSQAIEVFTKIFKMFTSSGSGLMSKTQCSQYVNKATQTSCSRYDSRITSFYDTYDKNRDGYVTLQQFLKFFYDSSVSKPHAVWKNLSFLRFRRDLKYYDEPIQLGNKNLMLRTHLCESNKIYQMLFSLLQESQENEQIYNLTKQFLNRLPTYPKVINSIEESFNLLSKNAFLSQYMLIALQQQLHNKVQNVESTKTPLEEFIKNKYYLKIYQYLITLGEGGKDLQKCRAICLHILRSLIPVPSLRNQIGSSQEKTITMENIDFSKQGVILSLPENKLFQTLIKESLANCDIETYEISLVLLLTQKKMDSSWLKNGIFHQELDIRRITCNFILLSTKINPQAFDLFEIEQQQHCFQWFQLLVQIILYTKNTQNLNKIFIKKCQKALCRQQTLQKSYDPILNGNLNIIKTILLKSKQINSNMMQQQGQLKQIKQPLKNFQLNIPQTLCDMFVELLSRTLSNENRKILYELISILNVDKCIELLLNLIGKQYPTRQAHLRQSFVGIKNLGCICYMNSILQQFFFLADFRNFVMGLENKKKLQIVQVKGKKIVDDFLYQLQKMYIELLYSQKKYFDPTDFCLAIKDQKGQPISTTIQQDAHEFINQLFGKIEAYIKDAKKKQMLPECQMVQKKQSLKQKEQQREKQIFQTQQIQTQKMIPQNQQEQDKKQEITQNVIQKSFAGKTVTLITCKTCQNRNIRKQDITHLTVEVKGMSSLKQSFDKFTQSQEISDYQCDHCQKRVALSSIQKLLYKLPDTLIINLLRITFDVNTFLNIKVHSKHEFPDKLNLKDYLFVDENQPLIQQQTQYYLHGVVIHSGTSQSGHYYSLIKIDNQWYKFNDMSVTKFDPKDIPKQCYGGSETNDDWGQAKFSTNAYILFYSRQKHQPRIRLGSLDEVQQIKQQITQSNLLQTYKNSYSFLPQIVAENKRFYYQLQINQKSFFDFAIQLYNNLKPSYIKERVNSENYLQDWDSHPNAKRYQCLLEIFLKIVDFVSVYYDFPTDILFGIGQTIYQLFYLVPERSYKFFIDIDPEIYFYHLTTHNQGVVRELYKYVLNRSLIIFDRYYGFNWKGFKQQELDQNQDSKMVEANKKSQEQQQLNRYIKNLPEQCRQPCNLKIILLLKNYLDKILQNETIKKNLFKSQAFFQFWKFAIYLSGNILNFALDNNMLEILLDFVMGKDSPFKGSNQKRQQCPYPTSLSVLQIIAYLQQYKLGLQDEPIPNILQNSNFQMDKLRTLTYREKKILSDPFFYRKMLKDKHDQQALPTTLASLCFQNKKFSQQIAQLLITGFSSFETYESWLPLFQHIKMQLLLNDSFAEQRITWLLGIPQYSSICKLDYSLRDDTGSKSIQYMSNLFFMVSQNYQPLLQRLYEKRFRYDLLTITGIITLLQLLFYSDKVFNYVASLPPPTYNMITYVDWIETFVQNLQKDDNIYGIPKSDKETYVEQIKKLLKEYNNKITLFKNLPSLKYIVGKNQSLELDQIKDNEDYELKMYRHKTFIIQNKPTGKSNLSLPSDSFYHGHPIGKAKYFVNDNYSNDIMQNQEISTDFTVITLQIKNKTKKRLRLKFHSPTFNYQITTVKGDIDINLPHDPKPLKQLVDIQTLEDSEWKKQNMQEQKQNKFKIELQVAPPSMERQDTILKQIACPQCTFLNLGLRNCQLCNCVLPYQFL